MSLSGSGLVSKPMGESVGGQEHLGSPFLGRAGGMLSPAPAGLWWLRGCSPVLLILLRAIRGS